MPHPKQAWPPPETQNNCGETCLAWLAKERFGGDVSALPNPFGMTGHEIIDGVSRLGHFVDQFVIEGLTSRKALAAAMKMQQPGTIAVVAASRPGDKIGHWFLARRLEDTVEFLETQGGRLNLSRFDAFGLIILGRE